MAAFGLEEAGHYGQALETGLAAVSANPDDVWGIHAVVHTYEMQGRVDEGIAFLTGDGTRWENGNLFTVHNWWHLALYNLEAGRSDRALGVYDTEIHHGESAGVPIEMLDASALLWRMMLDGVDTGERFAHLADAWAPKAAGDPWYAFNDLHAVMAFAGAGRLAEIRTVIEARERWLASAVGSNARMTSQIGLPACRAVLAFVEQRYDDVIAELTPIRRTLATFGGSHAQRDALQRTLLESTLRADDTSRPVLSPPSDSVCARRACTAGHNGRVRCGVSAIPAVPRMPTSAPRPIAPVSPTRIAETPATPRHGYESYDLWKVQLTRRTVTVRPPTVVFDGVALDPWRPAPSLGGGEARNNAKRNVRRNPGQGGRGDQQASRRDRPAVV